MTEIKPDAAGGQNVCALLDMIAWAEGTDNNVQPTKDRGYDVLVGGALFTDYSRHPDTLVRLSSTLTSSAAGRYQILARQWKAYLPILKLPDFSPLSQDLYAINQLRERGALKMIQAGRFQDAIQAICTIWASMPGSPYGQPTHAMNECLAIFVMHGGTYQ
jgi:muramidase (phage lysozyme)